MTAGSAPDATKRLTPVIRLAPAKLNLTLAVVGRRDDGYHALHSVMVPLGLADRLSVGVAAGGADSLHVTGFDSGPVDDNLVLRAFAAARAVVERSRAPAPPLAARLEKAVPVAAGLAGGSSDAAAALDAALEAWGADLDDAQRVEVAASLGSDVPFFLVGGAGLIEGRGERVTRLHGVTAHAGQPRHAGVLLVTPPLPAHTAAVFAAWSGGAMGDPGVARRTSEHFASEFGSGLSVQALLERAGVLASANDLWPAAASIVPGLVLLRRALTRLIHRPIGLSGSGPTLWALYPSQEEAAAAGLVVQAAAANGDLPIPGDGPPFIAGTTIETDGGSSP
ncbi:MAG: 4-(cytidine 5'-diphospho)-2-C-methyl-D-erythritol kinase [Chloroflexota bacterium]